MNGHLNFRMGEKNREKNSPLLTKKIKEKLFQIEEKGKEEETKLKDPPKKFWDEALNKKGQMNFV